MHVARTRTRLIGIFVAAALSVGVGAAPASAQQQSGLVNVAVVNNTVQVPIGVAANVCGIQVGILAEQLQQGPVNCTAVATAVATRPAGGGGGNANQQGLVNIFVARNTIQVPVGIAANICGVAANVLAQNVSTGTASCNAFGNATANG